MLDKEELLALSDFCVNVGDKSFRVHKPILAARSEVFMAMLAHAHNTDESLSVR